MKFVKRFWKKTKNFKVTLKKKLNLEVKKMEKYFILSYERGDIFITQFKAKDRDNANEIFEEEMETNFSSDWILDEDDFDKLVKTIKDFKKE